MLKSVFKSREILNKSDLTAPQAFKSYKITGNKLLDGYIQVFLECSYESANKF